ncbi:MAG: dihydrofolate reductase family protein, partial [Gemmatimonadales bacterium]
MRRLVMWNVQTLDGCFEGKEPWDLAFHEAAWGEELQQFSLEQANEVGTLLYGRATYEGMAKYWTTATGPTADFMNEVPKVVFSRTLDAATWKNSRLVRRDAADEVAE